MRRSLEIDPRDPHAQPVAEPEHDAAAATDQAMPVALVREVVGTETAHVHEAVDRQLLELHEQTEVRDAADEARHLLAEPRPACTRT